MVKYEPKRVKLIVDFDKCVDGQFEELYRFVNVKRLDYAVFENMKLIDSKRWTNTTKDEREFYKREGLDDDDEGSEGAEE